MICYLAYPHVSKGGASYKGSRSKLVTFNSHCGLGSTFNLFLKININDQGGTNMVQEEMAIFPPAAIFPIKDPKLVLIPPAELGL